MQKKVQTSLYMDILITVSSTCAENFQTSNVSKTVREHTSENAPLQFERTKLEQNSQSPSIVKARRQLITR